MLEYLSDISTFSFGAKKLLTDEQAQEVKGRKSDARKAKRYADK